jgi:hypothetical protein
LKHSTVFAHAVSSGRLFQQTACIALVRSVQAYVLVVWDPYLTRDIDKLERIDRNGARFITGDYKSRHEGAVTNMLNDLDQCSAGFTGNMS